jgi:molybdopterin-containing oxidoreductase family membrane subunit
MTTQAQCTGPVNGVLMAAGLGLVVSLGVTLTNLLSQGHAAFNTGSSGVTWGLPVAVYVFFVLTSTGLTFVASLAMVFGFEDFYPIAKRCIWLALATLVAGFASLALEMGHPLRMLWAVPLNFQYVSPLLWMGVFYAAYMVLLLLKFQKVNRGDWDSGGSRRLGVASFATVVVAHATLGAAFGMMAMRPFWFGPMVPLYFLITAAVSGGAFAILITYVAYGSQDRMPVAVRGLMTGALPKVFAAALGVALVATLARVATGLWSNAEGLQVWNHIVRTPWFWIEMIAMVAAFGLMVSAATRNQGTMQLAAALLSIVSLAIGRYEFVIGGQLVPLLKGSWVRGLIDYTPSTTEWMLALMALSLTFLVYALGERRLNLSAAPGSA